MDGLPFAIEIVKTLKRHGHIAYFAGGWVRDKIMGKASDDIDIATSASPEEVLDLFPRTLLVGLQFGVVIVLMDGHQFEVSTFRKDIEYTNGRKPLRIEQTGPKEDALRRDFTINGMFYDPIEEKIHDYVGGKEDILRGVVRTIGDPLERFTEDRLRMIRAFRFAARFGFNIEPETQEAIRASADTLFPAVAIERVWQEFTKMHAFPHFHQALKEMHRLGLLQVIFKKLQGVHLKEIEKRVSPIQHYPEGVPTAIFLVELFPEASLEELETTAKDLKVPGKEIDFILYYKSMFPFKIHEKRQLSANFYAHRYAPLCLLIYAARLDEKEKEYFLMTHKLEQESLQAHVDRIATKAPLIQSGDLLKEKIEPGKTMGMLLKEAERLAIELDIHNKQDLLDHLKKSPFWPHRASD